MNSLKVREFEIQLQNILNNSDIPWEVKRLVLESALVVVKEMSEKEIEQLLNERTKQDE